MKRDPNETRLRELLWRRELTNAERDELRRWLESHPDAKGDWELENFLSAALEKLPDAPVPSNFTSLVMQAVEREEHSSHKHVVTGGWWWRKFLPRLAAVAAVVCAGFFVHQRYEDARAAQVGQSLKTITEIESLPEPAFLQDFDAIRKLNKRPQVDEELLALLQ